MELSGKSSGSVLPSRNSRIAEQSCEQHPWNGSGGDGRGSDAAPPFPTTGRAQTAALQRPASTPRYDRPALSAGTRRRNHRCHTGLSGCEGAGGAGGVRGDRERSARPEGQREPSCGQSRCRTALRSGGNGNCRESCGDGAAPEGRAESRGAAPHKGREGSDGGRWDRAAPHAELGLRAFSCTERKGSDGSPSRHNLPSCQTRHFRAGPRHFRSAPRRADSRPRPPEPPTWPPPPLSAPPQPPPGRPSRRRPISALRRRKPRLLSSSPRPANALPPARADQ